MELHGEFEEEIVSIDQRQESRFEFLAVILREQVFGVGSWCWCGGSTRKRSRKAADWAVGRIESHGCLTSVN